MWLSQIVPQTWQTSEGLVETKIWEYESRSKQLRKGCNTKYETVRQNTALQELRLFSGERIISTGSDSSSAKYIDKYDISGHVNKRPHSVKFAEHDASLS